MNRRLLLQFAFILFILPFKRVFAAITEINRARIIIDLLKDGTVANETPYGTVDLASSTLATKYGIAFWTVHGPDKDAMGVPITNPTNTQLAVFFLKRLGIHCRDVLEASRVPVIGAAAAATEKAVVTTEAQTDLGVVP